MDTDFFREIQSYSLEHARVAAFGSTHHPAHAADADPTLRALISCGAPVLTIFGKSSERHAKDALRLEPVRNLDVIRDSVAFLRRHTDTVFFDAEHFFDGWRENADYTFAALQSAHEAGASALVLCDTNGGTLPADVAAIVAEVARRLPGAVLGIHAHNDCEMAVAATVAAVQAGATHIQGTINGVGERCGNANLCSIIPVLELKLNTPCLPEGRLPSLAAVSRYVSEVANMTPFSRQAFVGRSAFAHKGGVHVSAVNRDASLYEHIAPELVGNGQRVLISELGGRSNIVSLARRFGFHLDKDEPVVKGLSNELKKGQPGLRLRGRRGQRGTVAAAQDGPARRARILPSATTAGGGDQDRWRAPGRSHGHGRGRGRGGTHRRHGSRSGQRPGQRPAQGFAAFLSPSGRNESARLQGPRAARQPRRRGQYHGHGFGHPVLIESADKSGSWVTVGVDHDIIEASWQALADSVSYKLYRDEWLDHGASGD